MNKTCSLDTCCRILSFQKIQSGFIFDFYFLLHSLSLPFDSVCEQTCLAHAHHHKKPKKSKLLPGDHFDLQSVCVMTRQRAVTQTDHQEREHYFNSNSHTHPDQERNKYQGKWWSKTIPPSRSSRGFTWGLYQLKICSEINVRSRGEKNDYMMTKSIIISL